MFFFVGVVEQADPKFCNEYLKSYHHNNLQ